MIETLSIDEFESQVILIHKRSDGWRDACLLTGPYAGELIQVIPEKILPIRFDRYGNVVYGELELNMEFNGFGLSSAWAELENEVLKRRKKRESEG